jgi:hypothetical protein
LNLAQQQYLMPHSGQDSIFECAATIAPECSWSIFYPQSMRLNLGNQHDSTNLLLHEGKSYLHGVTERLAILRSANNLHDLSLSEPNVQIDPLASSPGQFSTRRMGKIPRYRQYHSTTHDQQDPTNALQLAPHAPRSALYQPESYCNSSGAGPVVARCKFRNRHGSRRKARGGNLRVVPMPIPKRR